MAGNIDADIRPKVEGFLLKILYKEGSYVEKGQPMFQLDNRQTQAAVEQAQGHLERARALHDSGPDRCGPVQTIGSAKGDQPS